MRTEFLRGKRKEESNIKEKKRERKEELGLGGIRQRKGLLWARKEHQEIEGQKLKDVTKKEMKRNQGEADQENHYKRKGVDLHYPRQPSSHTRRLYKQKRELPHPKLGRFTSHRNHMWGLWDFREESFFISDNIKSYGGLSWANALVPPAPFRLPPPRPLLPPPAPPTPSSGLPCSPPQTPHIVKHSPQRLSVMTRASDIAPWNEVKS